MKPKSSSFLKAATVAIALLGSTAIVGTFAVPDVAYAKEGNGNGGNGNGGGGGNGNGAGSDGGGKGNGKGAGSASSTGAEKKAAGKSGRKSVDTARGASNSKKFSLKDLFRGNKGKAVKTTAKTEGAARKSARSVEVTNSPRPSVRTKGNKIASLLGVHPSELGALNAANASETALDNAAPNSRVGRIANYRDTVLAGEQLRMDLEEKQALLDSMDPPERSVSEIEQDLEAALADVQENQDRVNELEEALDNAGGTDPDIEKELEEANADLDAAVDAADDLDAERQSAVEYEEAVSEVEELAEAVENQPATEREALEEAANKPVTDEVEAAVKSLLGL